MFVAGADLGTECVKTVVVNDAVVPWRYPPMRELQYGEWLRTDSLAGVVPDPVPDPDLALILTEVLIADRPLLGPRPAEVLDQVPFADVRRATLDCVPGLIKDIEGDTRNVLLTLARVWCTLATGEIRSKDDAATWAMERLEGVANLAPCSPRRGRCTWRSTTARAAGPAVKPP